MRNSILLVLILAMFVVCYAQDECKCGRTSLDYSCCSSASYCNPGLIFHCPDENKATTCTDSTPMCAKCKCGTTNLDFSCCKAPQYCNKGFEEHCDDSNRVLNCSTDYTPKCIPSSSFLDVLLH